VRSSVGEWRDRLGNGVLGVVATSAVTGAGLDELAATIFASVPPAEPAERAGEVSARHRVYRPAAGDAFRVERTGSGVYRVTGDGVERLIARHDPDNEEAMRYVEQRLRAIGVVRALEAAGFEPGDDVEIGGTVFELDPGAPFR
jgi:GTPase